MVARGVFHDVVQQPGFEADHVHLHVGQEERDLERVNHVGLARTAQLSPMPLFGELEGFGERRDVVLGPVAAHDGFQLPVDSVDAIRRNRDGGVHASPVSVSGIIYFCFQFNSDAFGETAYSG